MGDTGKSFLMLELCRRVGFGESKLAPPIFGGPVIREGAAVFITAEDNEATLHRRICSLDPKASRHTAKGERLIIIPLPNNGGAQAFWKHKDGLTVTSKTLTERVRLAGRYALLGRLPLEKFVSETIALDAVEEAFAKMQRGEVLRSVVVCRARPRRHRRRRPGRSPPGSRCGQGRGGAHRADRSFENRPTPWSSMAAVRLLPGHRRRRSSR